MVIINKKIFVLYIILFLLYLVQPVNIKATDMSEYELKINIDDNGYATGIEIKSGIKDKNNNDLLDNTVSRGSVWNRLLSRYKILIIGFSGFATITLVGITMFLFTKLAIVSGNPQEKYKVIIGIVINILAVAILGSVSTIFAFTYNVIR